MARRLAVQRPGTAFGVKRGARTSKGPTETILRHYIAFNGDADGLCALQQLRLADARKATLVTGAKRDIRLLRSVAAAAGDQVTVLDISFDENRADVLRLLDAGATVRYFDHHHAGALPSHPNLAALIEESPNVCTSSLVDRVLEHRYQTWAVVAAFGDNLRDVGFALAQSAAVKVGDVAMLERLGVLLNYNAYGNATSDLLFHPAELAERMLPFQDPMEFVRRSPAYEELGARYDDDMQRAAALRPRVQVPGALFTELPDEPWARRAIGVLANTLAQRHPGSAIAIAVPNGKDGYTVSVRVPSAGRMTADEFCRNFPGGNGRKTAAGINHLPAQDLHRFAAHFEARFRAPG